MWEVRDVRRFGRATAEGTDGGIVMGTVIGAPNFITLSRPVNERAIRKA